MSKIQFNTELNKFCISVEYRAVLDYAVALGHTWIWGYTKYTKIFRYDLFYYGSYIERKESVMQTYGIELNGREIVDISVSPNHWVPVHWPRVPYGKDGVGWIRHYINLLKLTKRLEDIVYYFYY